MTGWIKLNRKLLDNPIITKDAVHLAVWIYLLLNAEWQEGARLKPGQLITTRKKIAEQLNISESKVYRTLNELQTEQQIEQLSTSQGTVISIVNWNKYQKGEQQTEQRTEQQVNSDRTASEQQVNNLPIIKEYMNIKNNNNINNQKEEEELRLKRLKAREDLKRRIAIYRSKAKC